MDPPTLILIRHAAARGQEAAAPLTDEGRRAARTLANLVAAESADCLASSPMRRALETAQAVGDATGMPLRLDVRLAERVLAGEAREDWRALLEASFRDAELAHPGGESSRAATRRALAAISDMMRQGFFRPIVVTHGNLLTLLLRHFRPEMGFDDWERLSTPDAFRVSPVPTGWAIERLWSESVS